MYCGNERYGRWPLIVFRIFMNLQIMTKVSTENVDISETIYIVFGHRTVGLRMFFAWHSKTNNKNEKEKHIFYQLLYV